LFKFFCLHSRRSQINGKRLLPDKLVIWIRSVRSSLTENFSVVCIRSVASVVHSLFLFFYSPLNLFEFQFSLF
jgi:hypothetical protein